MHPLISAAREYFNRHRRSHAIAAAAGAFLALVGALGTGAASWLDRLVFWSVLLQAGSLCASAIGAVASRRLRVGESVILRGILVTFGVAAPMALFSWGLAQVVFAWGAAVGIAFFAWASLLVTGAMTALVMGMDAPGRATAGEQSPSASVKLRERLSPPFRGAEIYAVSAEDHYSRVHTSVGATLLLLRFADALTELDGIEGAQIHRSWWGARAAIVSARRDGRVMTLTLRGGLEAPVSRPNVKAVEESGWLARSPPATQRQP